MGFNFRKSFKIGPARVNLSKSGIGYSIGGKGARISKSPTGKTRVSTGIPGTGITYSKSIGSKKKASAPKNSKATHSTKKTSIRSNSYTGEPLKKNWFMAVIFTILAFGLVGILSFVLLFLAIAGFALFNYQAATSTTARNFLIIIPLILGGISSVVVFLFSKPDAKKIPPEQSTLQADPADNLPAENKAEYNSELQATTRIDTPSSKVVPTQPMHQTDSIAELLAKEKAKFNSELQAISRVDILLSTTAPKHLLKDLPDYMFSNITRTTRLDSIFPLVFLDVETTGLYPSKHEIVEVSAIKFDTGMIPVACFTSLCKPTRPIPEESSRINHITDDMVADAPDFRQIAPALTDFLKDCNVAGHNLDFDLRFIFAHGANIPSGKRFYDTLDLAQLTISKGHIDNYKLDTLCFYYGIWRDGAHRSLSDCYAASKVFSHLIFDKTSRQLAVDAEAVSESDTNK